MGSGGAALSGSGMDSPSKLASINKYGVLKLTLHPDSYDYSFLTTSGPADSASLVRCH